MLQWETKQRWTSPLRPLLVISASLWNRGGWVGKWIQLFLNLLECSVTEKVYLGLNWIADCILKVNPTKENENGLTDHSPIQRTINFFVRESITVRLGFSLTGLDSSKLENNLLFVRKVTGIQTSQTEAELYRDFPPYIRWVFSDLCNVKLDQFTSYVLTFCWREVVVAQLAERSLMIREDLRSNPVIGNFYWTFSYC